MIPNNSHLLSGFFTYLKEKNDNFDCRLLTPAAWKVLPDRCDQVYLKSKCKNTYRKRFQILLFTKQIKLVNILGGGENQ